MQGDAKVARKITVGIATPSVGGAAGDIVLSDKPLEGGYVGWVYTTNNTWKRFGLVSNQIDETIISPDKVYTHYKPLHHIFHQVMMNLIIRGMCKHNPRMLFRQDGGLDLSAMEWVIMNLNYQTLLLLGGIVFKLDQQMGILTQSKECIKPNAERIPSTTPTQVLDVVGTVKQTEFTGDGSALTGVIGIDLVLRLKIVEVASGTCCNSQLWR